MTETGSRARFGGRPAGAARAGCKSCGHPYALHGNGTTPCKAFACTAGPDGEPCQGFVAEGEDSDDEEDLLVAS